MNEKKLKKTSADLLTIVISQNLTSQSLIIKVSYFSEKFQNQLL